MRQYNFNFGNFKAEVHLQGVDGQDGCTTGRNQYKTIAAGEFLAEPHQLRSKISGVASVPNANIVERIDCSS